MVLVITARIPPVHPAMQGYFGGWLYGGREASKRPFIDDITYLETLIQSWRKLAVELGEAG